MWMRSNAHVFFGLLCLGVAAVLDAAAVPAAQDRPALTAPEAFTSQLKARTATAGAATSIRVQIDRYPSDAEQKRMTDGLQYGGYPGFVTAIRKAAVVGTIELGDEKFTIRWAREQASATGRSITIVTDKPMYFVGGGRVNAKSREGYELAVVQMTVDGSGSGLGTMAAAARVKPDGRGGVVVDDYADEPIELTAVRREKK